MLTFSLNNISGSDEYASLVWDTITRNLGYFKKFNHDRWEEAVHKSYISALDHRDSSYEGDILPYIKKLARNILKERSNESVMGVYTDEGEISPIFASLREYIDTDTLDGAGELMDKFKEMYLLDPESFNKLKNLYVYNDIKEISDMKEIRIRNKQLRDAITGLVVKYGSDFTFRALYEFFKELPKLVAERETGLTKEITLKAGNFSVIEKIPDTPLIQDTEGNYYYIDKNTLTMDKNPDYFKWDIIGSSLCDILKIDIEPFMNYMYEQSFVDQGVPTKHISWCGDKYKLVTPGGIVHVGLELEKFLSVVRIELILNLMANNVGVVVALSPDSVYIKPTRAFQFDKIRLKFQTGKIIDLPITLHVKRRKR